MHKYLFLFTFLFIAWGCSEVQKPETPKPECSIEIPCADGFKCENEKCVEDTLPTTCSEGKTKACYTGGTATRGIGLCTDGEVTCKESGEWDNICKNEVKPISEICGDGKDNNCDGEVDENCGCGNPGDTRPCYTGALHTKDVGICLSGSETCGDDLKWSGACEGEVKPKLGLCEENLDNDCNGTNDSEEDRCDIPQTDCTAGERRDCHTEGNNINIGICKAGYNLCNAEGSWGNECLNEVKAADNDICDGVDNNCDGTIDENCDCTPGEEKPCYTGDPNELGKGSCESGIITCNSEGEWNSECQGETKSSAEICDGKDNNCDGLVDNGAPNVNACGNCEALPAETCDGIDNDCDGIVDNVSAANGGGACGNCQAVPSEICGNNLDDNCDGTVDNPEICEIIPECEKTSDTDICDNGLDDDCDGSVDNGSCTSCGSQAPIECFSGSPSSVMGNGANGSICKKGTSSCVGGESWGICENEVLPAAETCNNLDDNCDGVIDDGFNVGETCTVGIGACQKTGVYSCNNQGGVTCVDEQGAPLVAGDSQDEICDGIDNNCNGSIDETFALNQNCYGGLGECQALGKTICSTDHTDVICDATPSQGSTELCGDGLDNDCNGYVDDIANMGQICQNGVGGCARTGNYECDTNNNTVICNAVAGQAVDEICGDSIDNDCDSIVDTDPELGLGGECTVGRGVCENTGGYVCIQNTVSCEGTPGTADPRGEICNNNLDDDCDGEVDETPCYSPLAVTCPSNYPNARPHTDNLGRAFTLTSYPFTATVTGASSSVTYRWELVSAPSGNGQSPTSTNTLTTSFEPYLISARELPADPEPYELKFTATDNGNTASCSTKFYAVSEDLIHVELVWTSANDMDLHMVVPDGNENSWEKSGNAGSDDCGYNNCRNNGLEWYNSSSHDDNPQLDIDNTVGFGSCSGTNCNKPENINVKAPRNSNNDVYRVAVYGWASSTGYNLKLKVNCLGANGLDVIKEYERSSLAHDDWWYMSNITWMGDYCVVTDR